MVTSSPIASGVKQILPERVGDTKLGHVIASNLPERLQRAFLEAKLGGLFDADKQQYRELRAENPELRQATVEVGRVPARWN